MDDSGTNDDRRRRGGCRRRPGSACRDRGARPGTQPRVVVTQLPVGLVQGLELPGQAPRAQPARPAARSSADGGGSQSSITLTPIRPQPPSALGLRAHAYEASPASRHRAGRSRACYNAASAFHEPPAKTILICDDDQGMRDTHRRHPEARLPRADRLERRGGAGAAEARGRRSDPARRPAAGHQRLRRAPDRQGELQPRSSAS